MAFKEIPNNIPAILLEPVSPPPLPDPEDYSDIDIAVLMQRDEKALEACNAKLSDIAKIVKENYSE